MVNLTELNKASGKPASQFVVVETDGREVWWTPGQAREMAELLLENGSDPGLARILRELADTADAERGDDA